MDYRITRKKHSGELSWNEKKQSVDNTSWGEGEGHARKF